jgi:hypothetical protein
VNKKIYFILLLLFIFILSSCANKVDFYLETININDIGRPKIEFTFSKINDRTLEKIYKINTNKNDHIRVETGLDHVGDRFEGTGKMFFYPDFKQIPNGGVIQIFLYNYPRIEYVSDNIFILTSGKNVYLYFLHMLKDEKIITMISKDNYFELSESIIENYDFLELKKEDFEDVTIIDPYSDLLRFNVESSGGIIGGYIVKNKFDETLLWIN